MNAFLHEDIYKVLSSLYSEERILGVIEKMKTREDPRGYSTFADSTAWCVEMLKAAGLSDVRRIAHKADGETASFDFIMPQAWDLCGRSTLRIVEPVDKMIADTDLSTIYVSEYSAPTPEGGVTAELVDYASLDPKNPDCKGKYVFYRGYIPPMDPLYNSLASAGCAGIVFSAFLTTEHAPDEPSWTNGHGQIGWYHLKEEAVVPVFSVSPKTGVELLRLLAKGKVVLHGEMNTRIYDGEIYTVTATIPGRSEDEFAILAHLYEPFYSDDAQGFGVGLEVAILLKRLIDDGVLPQPEKTLRLIFSMERYGFAAFFAGHDKRILAALSIDTLTCLASDVLDLGFWIKESPLSSPFFGDMLIEEALKTFCPDVRRVFFPGNMSDDCWAAEGTLDIPTNWMVSGAGARSDYHHSAAPIFDAIMPSLLKKLVPMIAAYTAVLVCGNRAHFAKLAEELEKTAADWLEIQKNFIAGRAAEGATSKRDALYQKQAAEMLYLGRMESFNRFYPDLLAPVLPEHWADGLYDALPDSEMSEAEKEAASIRYRILTKGVPFSQARVPAAERVCWVNNELFWALLSPERSVLDAIRLADATSFKKTDDAGIRNCLSYFAFLARYGYLEEVK